MTTKAHEDSLKKGEVDASLAQFYNSLAQAMKQHQFHFILSEQKQPKYGIDHTIFIPFEPNATKDEDGYGMYIFLNDIITPSGSHPCLITLLSLQLANTKHKESLGHLIHLLNLHLPIPGWILNSEDNLLHFKFLFPAQKKSGADMDVYLTLLAEIVRGFNIGFPLIREALEGVDASTVAKHLEEALV